MFRHFSDLDTPTRGHKCTLIPLHTQFTLILGKVFIYFFTTHREVYNFVGPPTPPSNPESLSLC